MFENSGEGLAEVSGLPGHPKPLRDTVGLCWLGFRGYPIQTLSQAEGVSQGMAAIWASSPLASGSGPLVHRCV